MNWVLEHLQILLGIAAAIAYYLNRRRAAAANAEAERPAQAGGQVSDEQAERTRRVQEEIRRKIAERRGTAREAADRQPTRERVPPLVRPTQVPPLDPFGGPMRRIVRKIEEAAAALEQRVEDPEAAAAKTAELARQAKLAEQLRELEAARAAHERRAAEITLAKKKRAETRPVPAVFGDVRAVLRDPREIRRAVILREVLGPPVGLR